MVENKPNRLTVAEAKLKVIECRDLAQRAINPAHRIMLDHMAETWERIAADIEQRSEH